MLKSLAALISESSPCTMHTQRRVILAHGRNRFAEEDFLRLAAPLWHTRTLTEDELHPDYQCSDVSVYCMTLREDMA